MRMAEVNRTEAKTMRHGEFHELDQALYMWLRQKREAKVEVTCGLLMEQARIFFDQLHDGTGKTFSASA